MQDSRQLFKKVRNGILEIAGRRIFYLKILMVVLGIFSALLILEIYSRVTYVKYHVPLECFQGDNVLNHSHVPGKTCPFVTREWNVNYGMNSFGFRDGNRTLEKPANTFRILMLGDSFTEGWGVAQDKTFSALLENKLNSLSRGRFEVINMGVAGYSPLLEYLQLKNIGLEFKPDLVILNFDYTDFADDIAYEELATFDENHNPVSVRPGLSDKLKSFAYWAQEFNEDNIIVVGNGIVRDLLVFSEKHSVLFRKLVVAKFLEGDINSKLKEPGSDSFVLPERNFQLISNMLRPKNTPFFVVLYPHKDHLLSKDNTAFFFKFQQFGDQNGIKMLNLFPLFRTKNPNDLYFRFDFHGTEKFDELMAKGIYDYLVKNKLIGS